MGSSEEIQVELALDMALLVLESGGSTSMADRTFANVLKGFRQEGVSALWRLDFITAVTERDGRSSTIVRPVSPVKLNLVRASEAAILGERAARREVDTDGLASGIQRIKKLDPPHNRGVTVVAAACAAAFFARTAGGDWGGFGVAFVAAGVGQFARSQLQSSNLTHLAVTSICALISAFIATLGLRLGFSQVAGATLVASIIYMVPGILLITGFVDVMSDKYLLAGAERLLNATFLFLALTITVAIADALI